MKKVILFVAVHPFTSVTVTTYPPEATLLIVTVIVLEVAVQSTEFSVLVVILL